MQNLLSKQEPKGAYNTGLHELKKLVTYELPDD